MLIGSNTGIASRHLYLVILIVAFAAFPFTVRWTGADAFVRIEGGSSAHTPAYLKFVVTVLIFEWFLFFIAWLGTRRDTKARVDEPVRRWWQGPAAFLRDVGLGFLTLLLLIIAGVILQMVLARFQHDSAAFRALFPQSSVEAMAFMALALTAGVVEEFVFRGYLQSHLTALCGRKSLASALQVLLFMMAHYYQGPSRLISIGVFGLVLTIVAIWRKSLMPGMIGHALGDSLVGVMYLLQHA